MIHIDKKNWRDPQIPYDPWPNLPWTFYPINKPTIKYMNYLFLCTVMNLDDLNIVLWVDLQKYLYTRLT